MQRLDAISTVYVYKQQIYSNILYLSRTFFDDKYCIADAICSANRSRSLVVMRSPRSTSVVEAVVESLASMRCKTMLIVRKESNREIWDKLIKIQILANINYKNMKFSISMRPGVEKPISIRYLPDTSISIIEHNFVVIFFIVIFFSQITIETAVFAVFCYQHEFSVDYCYRTNQSN